MNSTYSDVLVLGSISKVLALHVLDGRSCSSGLNTPLNMTQSASGTNLPRIKVILALIVCLQNKTIADYCLTLCYILLDENSLLKMRNNEEEKTLNNFRMFQGWELSNKNGAEMKNRKKPFLFKNVSLFEALKTAVFTTPCINRIQEGRLDYIKNMRQSAHTCKIYFFQLIFKTLLINEKWSPWDFENIDAVPFRIGLDNQFE